MLLTHQLQVRFSAFPKFFYLKKIKWCCRYFLKAYLEASGQKLDNFNKTRLLLSCGKLVRQKNFSLILLHLKVGQTMISTGSPAGPAWSTRSSASSATSSAFRRWTTRTSSRTLFRPSGSAASVASTRRGPTTRTTAAPSSTKNLGWKEIYRQSFRGRLLCLTKVRLMTALNKLVIPAMRV